MDGIFYLAVNTEALSRYSASQFMICNLVVLFAQKPRSQSVPPPHLFFSEGWTTYGQYGTRFVRFIIQNDDDNAAILLEHRRDFAETG
jgi:hypothetical protein